MATQSKLRSKIPSLGLTYFWPLEFLKGLGIVSDAVYADRILPELRKWTNSCNSTVLLYSGITSLHHKSLIIYAISFKGLFINIIFLILEPNLALESDILIFGKKYIAQLVSIKEKILLSIQAHSSQTLMKITPLGIIKKVMASFLQFTLLIHPYEEGM